jgi:GNAT superfamily N-acetyltransferase
MSFPMPTRIILRELEHTTEWKAMFRLIKQQNTHLTQKRYTQLLSEMRASGYRCAGAFLGGELVGVMGFWIGHRFWCDKYIDIDNVIVDKPHRSLGIGKKLLSWVEEEGKRQHCQLAVLDSYTTAHQAHRFYFREGYAILGYHFTKHF